MIDISGNTVVIDVIDFGLSKYLAGKTEIRAANWGQPDGSPKYMAPEVGAYTIEKVNINLKMIIVHTQRHQIYIL